MNEEEEEEEEEDEPAPVKSLAQESLGPKKEHVNVVFIGHVGKSCEWTSDGYCKSWRERLRQSDLVLLNSFFILFTDAGKSTIGGHIM